MISPYLERPVRTLEQALRDRIRIRIQSRLDASATDTGRVQTLPCASPQVRVLLGSQVLQASSGRLLPGTPTDLEAA